MRALDKKLVQDLKHIWMQSLAVAMVMACGVATLVIAIGSHRSLEETRAVFYDRYRFASVFSSIKRAPVTLKDEISAISGVSAVELRIVDAVLLDIPTMQEPATGLVVSMPNNREPAVNRLFLRKGRLPDSNRNNEVAITEEFADAHLFRVGDQFHAIINGRKQKLKITGIVLSPEFIYAIGPGDMVPDQRRFGVLFMPIRQLRGMFDMTGAFNQVSLATMRGVQTDRIIDQLDRLLAPYGGSGAIDREDQISNAFLDAELNQLAGMAKVIPPVFLLISAFLVNMIISRLIALEREQIGLLKAIGYSNLDISLHYIKLVVLISIVGLCIGLVAGVWLGEGLTRLYASFFSFPFLIFIQSPDIYLIAAGVSVAAAVAGAAKAIFSATRLPPAVAMRPAAPVVYRSVLAQKKIRIPFLTQMDIMAFRHLLRWPMRSMLTTLGTALSVALLVSALFSFDSIDYMIDSIFFKTNRQDATLNLVSAQSSSIQFDVAVKEGVLNAEPFLVTSVIARNRNLESRMVLNGIEPASQLSQVLDIDGNAFRIPESGIVLSEFVSRKIGVGVGDMLELELLEKNHRKVRVPVIATSQNYIGLTAYMDLRALNRLLRNGDHISGLYISVDNNALPSLYDWVKNTPVISSLELNRVSLKKFRETIGQNIVTMTTVYVVLAIIITFGVVYNSARIQLSERARELASLRVFGFTREEVSTVFLTEIGTIALLAQPVGWLLGYLFAIAVAKGFESDLYRFPMIVSAKTLGLASLVVLASALASAILVQTRLKNLDMVKVLKSRE